MHLEALRHHRPDLFLQFATWEAKAVCKVHDRMFVVQNGKPRFVKFRQKFSRRSKAAGRNRRTALHKSSLTCKSLAHRLLSNKLFPMKLPEGIKVDPEIMTEKPCVKASEIPVYVLLQKMAAGGRCRMSLRLPLSDFSIRDTRPARLTLLNAPRCLEKRQSASS